MSLLRLKSSVVLALAALIGLLLAAVALFVVQRQAAVDSEYVVIATRGIGKGTLLTEPMVQRVKWPSHLKPFSALQSVEEAVGRVAKKDLLDGEPVQDSSLWAKGQLGDLNDQLQIGDRAISLRINELVGVPADDLVGQFVDLVGTRRESGAPPTTETIVERVRVLAVAKQSGQSESTIKSITVSVSPEQVAPIEKARLLGSITVLVRNPRDVGVRAASDETPKVVKETLAEKTSPRTPAAKATAPAEIELILGTRRISSAEIPPEEQIPVGESSQ